MATAFDVNLIIGSQLAFNIVGGGIILGGSPSIQTVENLNGDDFTTSSFTTFSGPLLQVNTLEDFVTPVYTTSSRQTVYLTNIGSAVLTITALTYSFKEDIGPRFFYQPGAELLGTGTISILPGNTSTFEVAYRGTSQGIFNNYFTLGSNSIGGFYRVLTHQVIGINRGLNISPYGYSTSTTHYGQTQNFDYKVIPLYDGIAYPDFPVAITTSITGSSAWSLKPNTATNTVSVKFNPNEVGNVNGTYISTVTVTANGGTVEIINTGTVNIDHTANKNLTTWSSPASHYNSIIGMSYDLYDNQRILTIGVGMGADGSPIYGDGGNIYVDSNALGLGAETLDLPYAFWANVYRIPFTGAAQTYTSNDYIVKTTEGVDYSSYFGEYGEPGSMFIVLDDGYGSITVEMNHLRELSGDAEIDTTLQNLTRAFYYYSGVDILGRYTPLPVDYSAPIASNTATTNLFIGFEYNNRDKIAGINTSIVEVPT